MRRAVRSSSSGVAANVSRTDSMERDRTIVRAQPATGEEVGQCETQPFTMLVPVVERFAFGVRAVATAELNRFELDQPQFSLELPIGTALAFCASVGGDQGSAKRDLRPFVAVISITT